MNQGHSGVKEVIQEKQSKHCLVTVERGSFYPGTGMAKFHINYSKYFSVCSYTFYWTVDKRWWIVKESKKKKPNKTQTNAKLCATTSSGDSSNFFEKYVWMRVFGPIDVISLIFCFRLGSILSICKRWTLILIRSNSALFVCGETYNGIDRESILGMWTRIIIVLLMQFIF